MYFLSPAPPSYIPVLCQLHSPNPFCLISGLRAFLMKEDGAIMTQLLAVKQYSPGKEVSDERAGECVRLWSGQVLEEWGFGWKHVLGVVTDSESGVRFAFGNTPGIFREWCIPHLLNRAIIDAFGLSLSPATSKNPPSRAMFGDMKKDIEHVNKSTNDNVSSALSQLPVLPLQISFILTP